MIVAECGVNWNGSLVLARQMIFMAKRSGASMVKFQLFDCEKLARTQEQFDALKPCQLTYEQAESLFQFGQEVGIEVFFSVFDPLRVEWCEKIGVKRYKIAATMADHETIEAVRATGKPVIASTIARDATMNGDARRLPMSWQFLYCVPEYPAPLTRIHLPHFVDAMVGFSDHTVGLDASMIALARGAQIVEKHFVISRDKKWPEESFSMSPDELKRLVSWEKTCGEVGAAVETKKVGEYSLFAVKDIQAGEPFTDGNVQLRQQSGGLPAGHLDWVKEARAAIGIKAGTALAYEHIEIGSY